MKFRQGQSAFFLLIACFMVTSALIVPQIGPAGIVPASGPESESPPFYISPPQPSSEEQVIIHPEEPSPGDFLVIEAGPVPAGAEVNIDFDFPGAVSNLYRVGNLLYAVIGVSYESNPGSFDITIRVQNPETVNRTLHATVHLAEKEFQTSRFSMPARVTEGWTAARLAEDREKVRAARSESEPHPLWLNRFSLPLEGRITSEYGAIRIINNNPPRRHAGIDIAEEAGTPIVATNRGIVRLAEELLSGGKTVILDHGISLSSTYMHLDSIAVEKGQTVEREQKIGAVGMTGYATGPHLHWEVNLGTTPLNPEQLLDNDLLWIPPAYVEKKLSTGP